ncbi:MAG: phenylacetic acid degradation operon negative regulatory protein [Parcubacteria group bacterium Gr01-1014_3]|nr:MAG: phenylacetic acid degradation operon negative regulatory protein [Parcubacteria group bacterium Gr01-1014_3]
MAKIKFSGEITKNILLSVARATAVAGLVVTLAAMPGLGMVVKEFMDLYNRESKSNKFKIRKTFEELKRARLIKSVGMSDGSLKIVLTENGKKFVLQYNIDEIKINKPIKWDGFWRFVIFDVPNTFSKERRNFRLKLRSMGFYQLQKSVWIYPYQCKNEIDFISEYLRISPYIRLIEVSKFEGSKDAMDHFSV